MNSNKKFNIMPIIMVILVVVIALVARNFLNGSAAQENKMDVQPTITPAPKMETIEPEVTEEIIEQETTEPAVTEKISETQVGEISKLQTSAYEGKVSSITAQEIESEESETDYSVEEVVEETTEEVTEEVVVKASEESLKAIVHHDENTIKTMMVLKSDLDNKFVEGIDFEYIEINEYDGWYLLTNKEGLVGEVLGREKYVKQVRVAGIREENRVKKYFDGEGYLLWYKGHEHVREGLAKDDTQIGLYLEVPEVAIVHFYSEEFNRIVVIAKGKKTNVVVAEQPAVEQSTEQPAQEVNVDTPVEETKPTAKPTEKAPQVVTLAPTPAPTTSLAPTPVPNVKPTVAPVEEQDNPDERETWEDHTAHNEQNEVTTNETSHNEQPKAEKVTLAATPAPVVETTEVETKVVKPAHNEQEEAPVAVTLAATPAQETVEEVVEVRLAPVAETVVEVEVEVESAHNEQEEAVVEEEPVVISLAATPEASEEVHEEVVEEAPAGVDDEREEW